MDPCPFCEIASGREDADLVVVRTAAAFVVPALKQRRLNRGHALVLPTAHVVRLADAEPPVLQELFALAGRVGLAQRRAFGATGTTLFQNEDAPDQIISHLHVHVVPRGAGDGFRMPDPAGETLDREERRRQALALRREVPGTVWRGKFPGSPAAGSPPG